MKAALFALLLTVAPAFAEGGRPDMEQGFSLLDRGAELLLRGLMAEVEPRLRDLAEKVGPGLQELQGLIGDLDAYHAPEILPNGDIIIRRKVPLVPNPGPEIDL